MCHLALCRAIQVLVQAKRVAMTGRSSTTSTGLLLLQREVIEPLCVSARIPQQLNSWPMRFHFPRCGTSHGQFTYMSGTNVCRHPPLVDLIHKRHSPFLRARQYLRSVISTSNPRLAACAIFGGHRTYAGFMLSDHAVLRQLARGLKTSSAWRYWKSLVYTRPPLSLAKVGDPRVPQSELQEEAEQFDRQKYCKTDWVVGRKLKRRMQSGGESLLDGRNKRLCGSLKIIKIDISSLHIR